MISVDWKPIYFIATLYARFTENLPQPFCLLAFFQIFFSFIQLFQHTASAFPSPRDLADGWQRFFQQSRSSSEGAWAPVLLAQQDKADIKLYSLFSQVSYSQATGGEIVLTLWRGEDLDQPGDKSQYLLTGLATIFAFIDYIPSTIFSQFDQELVILLYLFRQQNPRMCFWAQQQQAWLFTSVCGPLHHISA